MADAQGVVRHRYIYMCVCVIPGRAIDLLRCFCGRYRLPDKTTVASI